MSAINPVASDSILLYIEAMTVTFPHISLLTENSLLFTAANPPVQAEQQRLLALCDRLRARPEICQWVTEVVPGMGNLLLVLHADHADKMVELRTLLLEWWPGTTASNHSGRLIEIPVTYGGDAGPDLDAVARHAGLSTAEYQQLHCATLYQVYCIGFQPGFPYLGGMNPALAIPRKTTPSLRVAAGSVAIGGVNTGIYPVASPGGWHIIGRTGLRLFDPTAQSPCLLQPGDNVRFIPR